MSDLSLSSSSVASSMRRPCIGVLGTALCFCLWLLCVGRRNRSPKKKINGGRGAGCTHTNRAGKASRRVGGGQGAGRLFYQPMFFLGINQSVENIAYSVPQTAEFASVSRVMQNNSLR